MAEGRQRIMVVEDEGLVAAQIQETLEGLGYVVPVVVATGPEALAVVGETEPDLVLMDIQLKGELNGIETAKRIRARLDVPVVYLTAFSDAETLEEAKLADPYGYVVKPFEERSLHATIQMALYRHARLRGEREGGRWTAAVAESMSNAVVISDPKGAITFVNPSATSLFGLRQQDVAGKRIAEVVHVIDGETGTRLQLPVTEPLAEGRSTLRANCRAVSLDGTETPVEVGVSPLRDPAGSLFGLLFVFRATTERERVQGLVLRELEDLARLAKRSLPPRDAVVAGIRFDRLLRPALMSGGDLVGFADLGGGTAGFWGVDVLGQGVISAMFSLLLHSVLSGDPDRGGILVQERRDEPRRRVLPPAEVARELARRFYLEHDRNPFFTLTYGTIDGARGAIRLIRAGHPHPLFVRADGQSRWVKPEGWAIGLFPQAPVTEDLRLDPGDRLLVFSDGLVEVPNSAGERFGTLRLAAIAKRMRGVALRELVDAVEAEVVAWRGGESFEDDVSLIAMERA